MNLFEDDEEEVCRIPFAPFEEIPHTADWAIRACGRDLPEMFINAARGMYSLMLDVQEVEETVCLAVEAEAATLEGLLVGWLNELLYLTEREGIVFTRFQVISLEQPTGVPDGDGSEAVARLCAEVRGGPAGGPPAKYIKAATYHRLKIHQEDGLWVAEVVFDV